MNIFHQRLFIELNWQVFKYAVEKHVKIDLFTFKKMFFDVFLYAFLFLFVSKLRKCVFYMPKSPLSCLVLEIMIFFKNLQEAIFSLKKINIQKKFKLYF